MLRAIPAAKLYERWDWVRDGLLHTIKRTGERWLPEDIYLAIKGGTAHLFAIEFGGEDLGFAIMQQHHDADGPVLFIWALWMEAGSGVYFDSGDGIYKALDAKAREIGAKRIRMHSPRKGWEYDGHFTAKSIIYEREVTP